MVKCTFDVPINLCPNKMAANPNSKNILLKNVIIKMWRQRDKFGRVKLDHPKTVHLDMNKKLPFWFTAQIRPCPQTRKC